MMSNYPDGVHLDAPGGPYEARLPASERRRILRDAVTPALDSLQQIVTELRDLLNANNPDENDLNRADEIKNKLEAV